MSQILCVMNWKKQVIFVSLKYFKVHVIKPEALRNHHILMKTSNKLQSSKTDFLIYWSLLFMIPSHLGMCHEKWAKYNEYGRYTLRFKNLGLVRPFFLSQHILTKIIYLIKNIVKLHCKMQQLYVYIFLILIYFKIYFNLLLKCWIFSSHFSSNPF